MSEWYVTRRWAISQESADTAPQLPRSVSGFDLLSARHIPPPNHLVFHHGAAAISSVLVDSTLLVQ